MQEKFPDPYARGQSSARALCRKEDNIPVWYVTASCEEPCDFGYGLLKDCQHRGLAGEAAAAVPACIKEDGFPCVSATHHRNNPASGQVMQRPDMKYRYSCREQWMPKDIPVIFRYCQISFLVPDEYVNTCYARKYGTDFIENIHGDPDAGRSADSVTV